MSNHIKEIQSLENSISVYIEYKNKVATNHMTDELKQIKTDELDKQISECQSTIGKLKA